MKKLYFSLASILMLSVGYSQQIGENSNNAHQTGQPVNAKINSKSVDAQIIKKSVNGNISTTTVNKTGNVANNDIYVPNVNKADQVNFTHDPAHEYCPSHDITREYYESTGQWDAYKASEQQTIQEAQNYSQTKTPGTNTIAVIFHVVHEGEPLGTGTNVSNADIMTVYNDLVEDFSLTNADQSLARTGLGFNPANTGINFCLATQDPNGVPLTETGVTRVSTSETWFNPDDPSEVNAMKAGTFGSPIWDRNDYLNVWICDISNGAGSGTAGYAYKPTTTFLPPSNIDGIVIDYNLGVNNDNVLTHEVGHYLGLDHTWGGSGGCGNDDGLTDTPNTAGPSFDYANSCNFTAGQQTCSVEGQFENYMDYSNCTVMFTTEQSNLMNTILSGIRSSLLISPGCDPAGPPICDFISSPSGPGPVVIAQNGTVVFTDQSSGAPTSWTWTISGTQGTDWDYTSGTTANSQNPEVTFYNVGTYDVTLVATNGFGSCTGLVETGYVQVVAPTSGTGCDTLRNWDPADAAANGFYTYGPAVGGWGAYPGHADLDGTDWFAYQYAEELSYTGTAEVRRFRFPIFTSANESTTGGVLFKVYADDNAGLPGTVLASEAISLDDLNAGFYNEIDFTTPASVTGTFFAGFEVFYGTPQDTVLFGMTDTQTGGNDSYFIDLDGIGWTSATNIGITGSIALDVMLSNGPAPTASIDVNTVEVCEFGDVVVNGSASTNTTDYFWYLTDDNPVTTIYDDNFTAGTTWNMAVPAGDYQVWLFADGSCMTDLDTVEILVNPQVTGTINGVNTTCGENNGEISVTGVAGGDGSYEYSLDGVNWQTGNTFTNLPAGDYDVYVRTAGDGCESSGTVTINASTPLSGSATSTVGICPGDNTNLTATGGTSYTWYDGGTVIGSTATINVSPTVQTQYTVEISDGTCTDVQYSLVTVNPLPTVDAGAPQTVCDGASVTLTGSGASSYAWDNGVTDGVSFVPTSTTTYTVTGTDGNGCENTDNVTVTLNPTPSTATLSEVCNGTNTQYTVSFDVSGGTAPYTIGGGTGSFAGSTWTSDLINSGTPYNLTITDANGCTATPISGVENCTCSTDAGTMTTGTTITVCGNGSATGTFNNNETLDGDDVQEYYLHDNSGASLGTSFGTNTTPVFSFVGGMTYGTTYYISSVTGNNDGGGAVDLADPCLSVSQGQPVVWNDLPTVDAGTDQTVCENASVTLSGSGASSYTWDNGVSNNTAFNPTSTLTYTVTGTDVNGCQNTDQVTVTVNPLPTVDAGTDQTVCSGDAVTLSGSGATTYSWDNGVTNGTPFNPTATLTYTVTGVDGNGCNNTDQVTVTVNPLPMVDAGTDTTICGSSSITFTGSGAQTYVWDNGVTDGTPFTVSTTTTFTVTGTDANGCENTDQITVTVGAGPSVTAVITHDTGSSDGAIDVTISGGTAPYTISWDNGPTTEDQTGLAAGDYTITVTDDTGCEVQVTFTVLNTVSINDNLLNQELLIFPNPTQGQFTIQLTGEYEMEITDARGRLILKKLAADNTDVDLSTYEAGVYFIRINRDGINAVRKLMLK